MPCSYLARLGELDLEDDEDGAHPVDIEIAAKHVHPEYSPTRFTNDIAILTLKEAAPATGMHARVCAVTDGDVRGEVCTRLSFSPCRRHRACLPAHEAGPPAAILRQGEPLHGRLGIHLFQ